MSHVVSFSFNKFQIFISEEAFLSLWSAIIYIRSHYRSSIIGRFQYVTSLIQLRLDSNSMMHFRARAY